MAGTIEQLKTVPSSAEQIQEKQKSLDPLASVNMLRFDLNAFGQVLPETRERVCDEELSYLAEGVNRAACTSFSLKRENGELVYFDRGEWKPYQLTLLTGLRVAEGEAADDPRRVFLAERAAEDYRRGYDMQRLKPGQQMVWASPYPHKEAHLHGERFIEDCGFSPERQMGFLYRASCNEDGSVLLESQTIDRSDQEAIDKALAAAEYDPEISIEALTLTYDGALMKKYGGHFFAGRRDAEFQENAWEIIKQNRDLVEFHLQELETIADTDAESEAERERLAKEHTYGVWAAFKKRLNGDNWRSEKLEKMASAHLPSVFDANRLLPRMPSGIRHEVRHAFNDFVERGEVMIGCGGAIRMTPGKSEEDIFKALPGDVFNTIFGQPQKSGGKRNKYDFNVKMFCVQCQAPPKKDEKKKDCGPCGICRDCDPKAKSKGSVIL